MTATACYRLVSTRYYQQDGTLERQSCSFQTNKQHQHAPPLVAPNLSHPYFLFSKARPCSLAPMACPFHAEKPIEMLSAASANPMFSSPTRVLLSSSEDPASEAER